MSDKWSKLWDVEFCYKRSPKYKQYVQIVADTKLQARRKLKRLNPRIIIKNVSLKDQVKTTGADYRGWV